MTDLMPILTLVDGRPVVSSLKVAESFKKDHGKVLRSIRQIISEVEADPKIGDSDFIESNFGFSEYVDSTGRSLPCCDLARDGFSLLAMRFTGKRALAWQLRYITAFNMMEAELVRQWNEGVEGPKPAPLDLPVSTAADRAPLRALCAEWARKMAAPGPATQDHHKAASLQLKANFQLDTIKQLPVAWIPDAMAWVQERIDALQTQAALPASEPTKEVQMALPMTADDHSELDRCLLDIKAARRALQERTDALHALMQKRTRSGITDMVSPKRSMLVNMAYANDELFYGLDRQLNAIEYFAQVGTLAVKAFPAGR